MSEKELLELPEITARTISGRAIEVSVRLAGQECKYPFVRPQKMPRGANLVTAIDRGSSRWGDLNDTFHVSLVKSKSHWILWLSGIDDYDDSEYWELSSWCESKGVQAKEAAEAMLAAYILAANSAWDGIYQHRASAHRDALLSKEEVKLIVERALI